MRRLLVAVTLLCCLIWFFRDALIARFDLLYGDSYDGLIEVAILQHWYNVLVHGAVLNQVGWFAPYGDTLGYNDTYIVPGAFFTLARLLGADPLIAAFCSHVAMKAIGFLGMYALLRRGLAIGTVLALAGAAIFATANASLLHMLHAQLLSVGLIPWVMLAVIGAVRAALENRPRAVLLNGAGFAASFGLTALNAFYQAWFFSLFAIMFVPVALLVAGPERRRLLWRAARAHAPRLAVIVVLVAVALLPLIAVYLPKLGESGGHGWGGVSPYLPVARTFVNVGPGNLVWGALVAHLPGGEQRFGIAPGLLLLAFAGSIGAILRRRDDPVLCATALTTLILIVLAMRWSDDFSLWRIVYDVVPGGSAVRVVTRLLLFLLIPVIAIAVSLLQRWRGRTIVLLPVLAFLLVEQVQRAAPLDLDQHAHLRMLADVGPPPAWCDTFVVVSARSAAQAAAALADGRRLARAWGEPDAAAIYRFYRHNVDAMLIASVYDRATINGVSTFNPPDWNFARPDAPDYLDRVRRYAREHPVGRLCALDRRRSPHWSPVN